jgi:hypothetical protein
MPCEVVLVRVDFFKMTAVAMDTAKMLKKLKSTKIIIMVKKQFAWET